MREWLKAFPKKICSLLQFLQHCRDFDHEGVGCAEMLFRSNILALVGGGEHPRFPPTKVCFSSATCQLWNLSTIMLCKQSCAICLEFHPMHAGDDLGWPSRALHWWIGVSKPGKAWAFCLATAPLLFESSIWRGYWRCLGCISAEDLIVSLQVRAVKLRRDNIAVALEHKVLIYNFVDLKLLHNIETSSNTMGLLALSAAAENTVLACPGLNTGQVKISSKRLQSSDWQMHFLPQKGLRLFPWDFRRVRTHACLLKIGCLWNFETILLTLSWTSLVYGKTLSAWTIPHKLHCISYAEAWMVVKQGYWGQRPFPTVMSTITKLDLYCRSVLNYMMWGGQSLCKRTQLLLHALHCPLMANCLPPHQSEEPLFAYSVLKMAQCYRSISFPSRLSHTAIMSLEKLLQTWRVLLEQHKTFLV